MNFAGEFFDRGVEGRARVRARSFRAHAAQLAALDRHHLCVNLRDHGRASPAGSQCEHAPAHDELQPTLSAERGELFHPERARRGRARLGADRARE